MVWHGNAKTQNNHKKPAKQNETQTTRAASLPH
jgi:hypothetical protein